MGPIIVQCVEGGNILKKIPLLLAVVCHFNHERGKYFHEDRPEPIHSLLINTVQIQEHLIYHSGRINFRKVHYNNYK